MAVPVICCVNTNSPVMALVGTVIVVEPVGATGYGATTVAVAVVVAAV
jgi:hypothetical protein